MNITRHWPTSSSVMPNKKYSKLLEEGVEATIIESGIRTAVIGNFIGNIIESNSTDERASRQAA